MMTDEQKVAASEKALSTWQYNVDRQSRIESFRQDKNASATLISQHTDCKSAYTVRSRLQQRYSDLLFKVFKGDNGEGTIYVKHDNGESWDTEMLSA